jgi:hypothetical protein
MVSWIKNFELRDNPQIYVTLWQFFFNLFFRQTPTTSPRAKQNDLTNLWSCHFSKLGFKNNPRGKRTWCNGLTKWKWDIRTLVRMHLHWERSSNTAGDCIIRSLSWMGRVPDEIPQVTSPVTTEKFQKPHLSSCKMEKGIRHLLFLYGVGHTIDWLNWSSTNCT